MRHCYCVVLHCGEVLCVVVVRRGVVVPWGVVVMMCYGGVSCALRNVARCYEELTVKRSPNSSSFNPK